MDDWQEQLWKQVEKTASDMEKFFVDVEKATETVVEEVGENINSFFEQLGVDLAEEVDSFIRELVDVIVTTSDEMDAAFGEERNHFTDDDFTEVSFHTPSIQNNPACINCTNYHGQSYNGNLLVCAMHPEGWNDDNCPDWEADK